MKKYSTYILMAVTVLIWGGTYVAGRLLNPAWDNVVTSFVRIGMAFVVLVALCATSGVKLWPISRRMFLLQILLGLSGLFMYTLFFHKGIQTLEGGRAAVIINTNPIMIAMLAALFLHEKLTPLKIAGVLLAAIGAVYVVSHGCPLKLFSDQLSAGDGYMFIAAVSWAVFGILGKVALHHGMQPMASIAWSACIGMLLILPAAVSTGHLNQIPHYALSDWLAITYLGVGSTVCGFVFFYKIIRKVGATRAGVICSAIPIAAIVLTMLFLKEKITQSLIIGAAITVAGVFLVNYAPHKKTTSDEFDIN